jgi:hypothetical protein
VTKAAIITLAALLVFAAAPAARAGAGDGAAGRGKPSVHYGAYCSMPYGFRQHAAGMVEATEALKAYFAKRGLEVRLLSHDRRFLRADIYDGDERVDSILFDRLTGKMRSIY